jgi:coenzyme PQQ precursor peptide PqqA
VSANKPPLFNALEVLALHPSHPWNYLAGKLLIVLRRWTEPESMEDEMCWNKPKIKEVCVGLEINDYLSAAL